MGLSRDWDAARFYREIEQDLGVDQNSIVYIQRHDLINRAVGDTLEQIFPLLVTLYLETETLVPSLPDEGLFSHLDNGPIFGIYTVADDRITWDSVNGLSRGFATGDVGSLCLFRIDVSQFLVHVVARISNVVIQVGGKEKYGSNYPNLDA